MKSELIVDVQPGEISIALTEDDRLMEVSKEVREANTFAVGNIYLGKVKKIMPALNAAFVDVGYEKEAFLHYLDLGSQFLTLGKFTEFARDNKSKKVTLERTPVQPEVGKQGNIADVLKVGQDILVQVSKEPINTKGPRITAEISLAGRNIVLMPFGEKVMVSNKIRSEAERSRLKQVVQVIKPNRFGVIVRTQAEGKRAAELDSELKLLLKRWDETVVRLQKAKPVSLVMEEIGRTIGVIRDLFTPDSFTAIHVNDEAMCSEIQEYVSLIAPECEKIVHLYKDATPIFDHFQITRQMKTGLGRTVGFKNGGYLIMERTEALFSIDVNSGSKKLGTDQEDNAFRCNMLAADEIVHQLRLRDIGGIIIVDFIDMDSAEHRQLLFEHVRQLMKRDRARHNVLQLSKFGLMQITRQRVRMAVEMDVTEECPTCHGKGRIEPSILFTDKLEQECERYSAHFGAGLTMRLHPYLYSYVTKGLPWKRLSWRWRRKYGVRVVESQMLGMLEYRFLDKALNPLLLPFSVMTSVDEKETAKSARYATLKIEEKPEVNLKKKAEAPKAEPKVEPKKEQPQVEQPKEEVVVEPPVETPESTPSPTAKKKRRRKKKTATPQEPTPEVSAVEVAPQPQEEKEPAAEAPKAEPKAAPKKARKAKKAAPAEEPKEVPTEEAKAEPEAKPAPKKRAPRKKATKKEETPSESSAKES